jgi:hypothetical protein
MPFEKGKSGNPSGSNGQETRKVKAALTRALKAYGDGDDVAALEKLGTKLLEMALAGDLGAHKEVYDRIDGKSVQSIQGTDDGPPINHSLTVKFVGTDD